jgi:vacuolar-type H+-ATPase subunit E/Vma4
VDTVEQHVASNDKKIDDVETRINKQVKDSIEKLPQRLLSEEAKNALKQAVLTDIRAELQQLRSDMQSQIDELKKKKDN